MLCPSHSLFLVYTGKHLDDKNLNNMIYGNNYIKEITSNQFCSIVYLWVTSVQDLCYVLLWEIEYFDI